MNIVNKDKFKLFKKILILSGALKIFEAKKKPRLITKNSVGFSIEFTKSFFVTLFLNLKNIEIFFKKIFFMNFLKKIKKRKTKIEANNFSNEKPKKISLFNEMISLYILVKISIENNII
tara:strand:- start:416 stop:772 length:357 start_codon:yes stop_codon:yes gene_type:complete